MSIDSSEFDPTTVETPIVIEAPRRKKDLLSPVISLFALGVVASGGVLVASEIIPSFTTARIPMGDHYIWPFTPDDCPDGWTGPAVDPIRLAKGFRAILSPVLRDYNVSLSQSVLIGSVGASDPENYSSPEATHLRAVRAAAHDLQTGVPGFPYSENFDETAEVSCEASDESYMATAGVLSMLDALHDAGYGIDLLSGEVSLPQE
jgi:hypothetical protein